MEDSGLLTRKVYPEVFKDMIVYDKWFGAYTVFIFCIKPVESSSSRLATDVR